MIANQTRTQASPQGDRILSEVPSISFITNSPRPRPEAHWPSHEGFVNLWFVHQDAVPPSHLGLTRSYHLARGLQKRGHKVTVIASSFNHRAHTEILAPGETMRRAIHGQVEFLWLRAPHYQGNSVSRVWNMLEFGRRVRHLVPKAGLASPDVVVGSSPSPFAALGALWLAERYNVPFVLELRDLWPQSLVDLGSVPLGHPFVRLLSWIERKLYYRAARIVSVLPNAAAYMIEKGADAERIDWIPNGVDLELVPPPKPSVEDDFFTVFYAGAHGSANGLGTILDAAERLQRNPAARHVQLRFVGDGADKPALRRRASVAALVNLRFDDAVPNSGLYEILAEADAFVANVRSSPLYKYGIGMNKLYEYMAMARPTAIALSAFNNPVAEAGAGLAVAADDAMGLARAIAGLAAMSPQERWAMGLRGRRYVEAHHDYTRLAVQFEESLQTALAVARPRRCPARRLPHGKAWVGEAADGPPLSREARRARAQ